MTVLTRAQIDADIRAAVRAHQRAGGGAGQAWDYAIYAAALERAALLCEEISREFCHIDDCTDYIAEDCADAIRAAMATIGRRLDHG